MNMRPHIGQVSRQVFSLQCKPVYPHLPPKKGTRHHFKQLPKSGKPFVTLPFTLPPSSRGPEILLTLGLELASSFFTLSSQSSLTAQTVGRRHYGLSCSVGSHSEFHTAICPPPPPDLHSCLQKFFYRTQSISPLTWLSLAWSPPAHPCSSW